MKKMFLTLMLFSAAVCGSYAAIETENVNTEVAQSNVARFDGIRYTDDYDEHPFSMKLTISSYKLNGTFRDEVTNKTYKVSGRSYEDFSISLNVMDSKGNVIAVIKASCLDPYSDDSQWEGTYQEKTGKKRKYAIDMSQY